MPITVQTTMQRTSVTGTSGAGKTTVAARLAAILDFSHYQLDALHWGPNWQPRETEAFERAVDRAVAGDRWVIDGNYSRVRDRVWSRATHVIWLNYSFPRVMYQLTRRTFSRALTGEELYSGNRETLAKALLSRESIILWGLRTFHRRRREYRELLASETYARLHVVELHSPSQTEQLLHQLKQDQS